MSYPAETDEHGDAIPTVNSLEGQKPHGKTPSSALSRERKQPVTLFKEVWVWSKREEQLYRKLCRGFTLHVCSGKSLLGDVKCDLSLPSDLKADMYHLPFRSFTFDTVITDPPWHGPSTWHKWETLIKEITRISRKRIIFVLGNLIFILQEPWHLKHVYLLKKISPQIKLIYVWERPGIL